jgi:superfamily I DNA/RNA helicase
VRGRSSTLKVNYRTSHQIRRTADRLLPGSVRRDIDGIEDARASTISVFDGPEPEIVIADDAKHETALVADLLCTALANGTPPGDIGIFVRSQSELQRGRAAPTAAGLVSRSFVDREPGDTDTALIGTMHLAKGLEFPMVVLMACDDSVLPLAERVGSVADAFELDEVLATERQLFYVPATRARDRLIVSAAGHGSEFIDDLRELG